jgi:hypothetical protein
MKVWYLAHPVAPDALSSFDNNMNSLLSYIRVLHSIGIHVQAPYYANLAAGLDDNDPEVQRAGIEGNLRCLNGGYDGLVLCGHKMSSGMRQEFESFCGPVLNFIGMTEDDIRACFTDNFHSLQSVEG